MTDTVDTPPSPDGPYDDLPGMAAFVALDAVDEDERAAIDAAVAAADPDTLARYEELLRRHREALADYSGTSAVDPPGRVLGRVLARLDDADTVDDDADAWAAGTSGASGPASLDAARERRHLRTKRIVAAVTSVAAAVIIAVGGIIVSDHMGTPETPTTQSVMAEPDVRTVATTVDDGTASVAFSRDADAAVLVMDDVPQPADGTVYQLWLLGPDHEPKSVGIMGPQDVHPKTQALIDGIAHATGLGISVEPTGGSPQPTDVVAKVSLT